MAIFAAARLTLWQFDEAGHLRLTWVVFAIAAGLLMAWRIRSAPRLENGLGWIDAALRQRNTIFVYSLTALGSLALVAFAYMKEAPPFPLCSATPVSASPTAANTSPASTAVTTGTPAATPSPSSGNQTGLIATTPVPCVAATSAITGAAGSPAANAAAAAATPHEPAPGEITSEDAARRRWSGLKDWLPEDLHGLALYAVWFGALGGVAASLKGIYDHANDWDKSNALWHYGRPFSSALVGGVTYVLLLVASAQNQTALATPAILVVAFALGTQDRRFFHLLYSMVELIVATPDSDVGNLTISSIKPTDGSPGDTLTILGTNFVQGSAVRIDGVEAADVVAKDGTQITATVPKPSGELPASPVDVAVVNPNGVAYVKTAAFTYRAATTTKPGTKRTGARETELEEPVPEVVRLVLQAIEAGPNRSVVLTPEIQQAIRKSVDDAVAALPPSDRTQQAGETFADQTIEILKTAWGVISSDEAAPIREFLITRLVEAAREVTAPEGADEIAPAEGTPEIGASAGAASNGE